MIQNIFCKHILRYSVKHTFHNIFNQLHMCHKLTIQMRVYWKQSCYLPRKWLGLVCSILQRLHLCITRSMLLSLLPKIIMEYDQSNDMNFSNFQLFKEEKKSKHCVTLPSQTSLARLHEVCYCCYQKIIKEYDL